MRKLRTTMEADILSSEYFGFVAATYVNHLLGPKWSSENAAVEALLASIPEGASVLDVPVGTGRFFPLYMARKLTVCGIDVSEDMLEQAANHAEEIGATVTLAKGDIRDLPFPDSHFDLVLCVRFLNLAGDAMMAEALREIARVSHRGVLIGVRYLAPYAELGRSPFDLLRRLMRLVRLPNFRSRRWGLTNYSKDQVEGAIREAGLLPVGTRLLEKRWDGTDYVFLHLTRIPAPSPGTT